MQTLSNKEQELIAKIRSLSPSLMIEVEDFIDFLSQRRDERDVVLAAAQMSESAFAQVWDNPDDAAYDNL
jgi:energy-converting hydrogenase A subunit M